MTIDWLIDWLVSIDVEYLSVTNISNGRFTDDYFSIEFFPQQQWEYLIVMGTM